MPAEEKEVPVEIPVECNETPAKEEETPLEEGEKSETVAEQVVEAAEEEEVVWAENAEARPPTLAELLRMAPKAVAKPAANPVFPGGAFGKPFWT